MGAKVLMSVGLRLRTSFEPDFEHPDGEIVNRPMAPDRIRGCPRRHLLRFAGLPATARHSRIGDRTAWLRLRAHGLLLHPRHHFLPSPGQMRRDC
jgi:hypothetical protein